jgi:hypothetical protein
LTSDRKNEVFADFHAPGQNHPSFTASFRSSEDGLLEPAIRDVGQVAYAPDTIQEFKVQTSLYDAQLGEAEAPT